MRLVPRAEITRNPHWARAFSSRRKDHRYYELVEDTICPEVEYRYFVLRGNSDACAIQPSFVVDQDLLAGMPRWFLASARIVRYVWPRFMHMRTLMVGCAAGEGHLDADNETCRRELAQFLAHSLIDQARRLKVSLVVFKEFPAEYRASLQCLRNYGYYRIPSLPGVSLNINYADFNENLI